MDEKWKSRRMFHHSFSDDPSEEKRKLIVPAGALIKQLSRMMDEWQGGTVADTLSARCWAFNKSTEYFAINISVSPLDLGFFFCCFILSVYGCTKQIAYVFLFSFSFIYCRFIHDLCRFARSRMYSPIRSNTTRHVDVTALLSSQWIVFSFGERQRRRKKKTSRSHHHTYDDILLLRRNHLWSYFNIFWQRFLLLFFVGARQVRAGVNGYFDKKAQGLGRSLEDIFQTKNLSVKYG